MSIMSSARPLDAATRAAWQSQLASARPRPGLLPLLVRQRRALLPRFAAIYAQLRALPKGRRRRWQRRLHHSLAGVALVLTLLPITSEVANFTGYTA